MVRERSSFMCISFEEYNFFPVDGGRISSYSVADLLYHIHSGTLRKAHDIDLWQFFGDNLFQRYIRYNRRIEKLPPKLTASNV